MATSSFTSSVTVNRNSAKSLSKILSKNAKANISKSKKIVKLEKEEIKNYKFK